MKTHKQKIVFGENNLNRSQVFWLWFLGQTQKLLYDSVVESFKYLNGKGLRWFDSGGSRHSRESDRPGPASGPFSKFDREGQAEPVVIFGYHRLGNN